MLTPEKIAALRKRLKKGEPEGEIREELKKEGFTEEEIAAVFTPHHYDMRSWYLFFAIIISLAGVYVLATNGGVLLLVLGLLLFGAYQREIVRLKKRE